MSNEDLESQAGEDQEAREGRRSFSRVAEISLTETHVHLKLSITLYLALLSLSHLFVTHLDCGTSLLVITGCSLHALSLRGYTVVIVTKVLV